MYAYENEYFDIVQLIIEQEGIKPYFHQPNY